MRAVHSTLYHGEKGSCLAETPLRVCCDGMNLSFFWSLGASASPGAASENENAGRSKAEGLGATSSPHEDTGSPQVCPLPATLSAPSSPPPYRGICGGPVRARVALHLGAHAPRFFPRRIFLPVCTLLTAHLCSRMAGAAKVKLGRDDVARALLERARAARAPAAKIRRHGTFRHHQIVCSCT